jgi:ribosome biogenesis GTPase
MAKKRKGKIRADFRKNRGSRTRRSDWTQRYEEHGFAEEDPDQQERVSGKGELTRKRTVIGAEIVEDDAGLTIKLDVDESVCLVGRVLRVQGLVSTVEVDEGVTYACATRRLLKTLSTDQRHVVAAGDHVLFRPSPGHEGIIERVEPRHGVLSRTSRGRRHILVANVDQVMIIGSAAQPDLKPHLIDRLLITAEKVGARPVICINKIDLVDSASLQPMIGVWSQMGYQVLLLSAETGFGIERLRRTLSGHESVVTGQSGVGKSSLLNALEKDLSLRVRTVSAESSKGRHTTSTAELIPLSSGGYVVDTPGIRQFQLWDVTAEEIAGFFRDVRPYVNLCKFPDCTHRHEADCAVKDAVADGRLDVRRYESYCHLYEGDFA